MSPRTTLGPIKYPAASTYGSATSFRVEVSILLVGGLRTAYRDNSQGEERFRYNLIIRSTNVQPELNSVSKAA